MKITDYHDAVDGVPLVRWAYCLEKNSLVSVTKDRLEEIIEENDSAPIKTEIHNSNLLRLNPFNYIPSCLDWSLRRRMRKTDSNFVYIQEGHFYLIKDYFKI